MTKFVKIPTGTVFPMIRVSPEEFDAMLASTDFALDGKMFAADLVGIPHIWAGEPDNFRMYPKAPEGWSLEIFDRDD